MPVITVSRTYLPGDLIYKEEPFVQVLPRLLKNDLCESCRCRPFNLRACKQCLSVKYCGRVCQKKDWVAHRLECKHMANLVEGKSEDFVRLLGRVILKIKGKDWKSFKISVLGNEVSFDDIDSHYKEMTENPFLNLLYKELKELTKTFIGQENMPSDIDFLKITGKVLYNSFCNFQKLLPALCFFIGMFMFEHECIPNSSFIVSRSNLKVWANKKIDKGSEKITVSFRPLFSPNVRICGDIESKICNCSDCSLPYGEAVLSKILDEKRAFSIIIATRNILKNRDVISSFNMESLLEEEVDKLLKNHTGILGRTNSLHLRLLGYRFLQIGGRLSDLKSGLLELESIMRSVYGEFYIEMHSIYEGLAEVNLHLGNIFEARLYLRKVDEMVNISRSI